MPSACTASRVAPLARSARQQLGHETALGADRNDDRVLDLLRLDQAEDLGAEVLRPVGPADAAARDLAEAQVHAFDARRVDEDLVERPRQRQAVDPAAGELDGDQLLRAPVGIDLIEIGADGGLHRIDEVPQDAILVEACDVLAVRLRSRPRSAVSRALRSSRRSVHARIETRVEQAHDLGGNRRMLHQRRPHVVLGDRARGSAAGTARARISATSRHIIPAASTSAL